MRGTLDFFIAGVQKGGTTSLHAYLSQHPALAMSRPKELHIFDDEGRDWSVPDNTSLSAYFPDAQEGQLWGESTPIYLFWPPSMERIARHNPSAKLILLLRHPVERAYSHWRMEVARSADTASFSSAIREGRDRMTDALDGPRRVFSYVERGFYAEQMRRALRFFPIEQMLLLKSEDLRQDRMATLDRICKFLRVPRFLEPPSQRLHRPHDPPPIEPMRQDDRLLLEQIYRDDLDELRSFAGIEWHSDAR